MTTYYVNNKPVTPKINPSFNAIRKELGDDWKEYWQTAQEFNKVVAFIVDVIRLDDSFVEVKTGELLLTPLEDYLINDTIPFENFDILDDDQRFFVSLLVYAIADELGVV